MFTRDIRHLPIVYSNWTESLIITSGLDQWILCILSLNDPSLVIHAYSIRGNSYLVHNVMQTFYPIAGVFNLNKSILCVFSLDQSTPSIHKTSVPSFDQSKRWILSPNKAPNLTIHSSDQPHPAWILLKPAKTLLVVYITLNGLNLVYKVAVTVKAFAISEQFFMCTFRNEQDQDFVYAA